MDNRLIWLALGAFAIGAEAFVISTLLPAISADTGATITQAGYLVLAYALAYAFGAPVLAALTSASDRRRVLTVVALVFAVGAATAGFASGYLSLLLSRVVMAFSAGLFTATAQATAVALSTPEKRARSVSIVVAGTTLAVALGAPIGALLAGLFGWRGTYFAVAALGVTAAIAIWVMLPAGIRGLRQSLSERLSVIGLPGVRPALLTTLLYMTGPFIAFVYIAPLTTSAIGLGREMLPVVMLAFGIGAAVGNPIGGQLADRFGAQRTVVITTVLSVLFMLAISLIPHLPETIRGPVFIAFMVPWGMVGWAFLPAQVSRLVSIAPAAAPLVLSLNGSAIYLGTALGAVVGGQVLEHGTPADLGWVAALFALAAMAVLSYPRVLPKTQQARLG
jgi:DHA1 family inner membrane transport protein